MLFSITEVFKKSKNLAQITIVVMIVLAIGVYTRHNAEHDCNKPIHTHINKLIETQVDQIIDRLLVTLEYFLYQIMRILYDKAENQKT